VLGRLGFTGRLMAIVMFALVALWAVGVGWLFVIESRDEIASQLFPLPEQVTAIVELLETVAPAERPAALKAVSSDSLQVTLAKERPQVSQDTTRLPLVERFLALYLSALQPRDVMVIGGRDGFPRWRDWHFGDYWRNRKRSLRLAVSLQTGDFVVLEALGPIGRRLFGLPPGFGVGLLGALIGMAAVIAIAREARPLRALSDAVGQFSGDAASPPVEPAGAPEIRKLIVSVNEMQARITELVRGRTLLLGAISHDLKTYITRLRLRVERLDDKGQRDKAVRDLDEMTRLLEDALVVARGGLASDKREPIDLRALLSGMVEDRLQSGAGIGGDLSEEAVLLRGEPVALRRLFTNLIDNALSFAPHCIVRLRQQDGAVVTIDDDGPGIPAQAHAVVFEPFVRLETSRSRSTGGSGLGLAIVKQIVDAHGARIALSTSPEGGLRVTVAFPHADTGRA
jgi:two-component system osmolarity sensor histidine kinase EnvZ